MTAWTDGPDASLKQLWTDPSMSAAKIAVRINKDFATTFSRNAVIGRASRLKLVSRAPLVTNPEDRSPRGRVRKPRTRGTPKAAPWSPPTAPSHHEPPLQAPEPSWEPSSPVTLAQLTAATCRYPLWDDYGPLPTVPLYCGGRPVPERSYCRHHCLEAYQPRRNDERERERHMRWKV